jgi:hypothetical protein
LFLLKPAGAQIFARARAKSPKGATNFILIESKQMFTSLAAARLLTFAFNLLVHMSWHQISQFNSLAFQEKFV